MSTSRIIQTGNPAFVGALGIIAASALIVRNQKDERAYNALHIAVGFLILALIVTTTQTTLKRQPSCEVDARKKAMFFIAVLSSAKNREGVLGCLEETYHDSLARFGERKARLLFWKDVLATASQLIFHLLARPVVALLTFAGMIRPLQ